MCEILVQEVLLNGNREKVSVRTVAAASQTTAFSLSKKMFNPPTQSVAAQIRALWSGGKK